MSRTLLRMLLLGVVASSCSTAGDAGDEGDEGRRITELAEPEARLGEPLMLALAQARNYHHKADVLLKEARLDEAAQALRQILVIRFPPGAPEGEDVTLDARARLAKLLITAGQLDLALAVIEEGLTVSSRPSFFLANLHTARGEVLEARAQMLEAGDQTAARATRALAIEAFDRSIKINEALMNRLGTEGSR